MKYVLQLCLLLHFINGTQIFVKEYTTVELVCPINQSKKHSLSWYFKQSTPISIQDIVNPKFKLKYRINDTLNEGKGSITILNFTESDQGKYSCEGIVYGKHQSGIVNAYVCNTPTELRGLSSVIKDEGNAEILHQTNILCANATVYTDAENQDEKYENCLHSAAIKLQISNQRIFEQKRMKYKQATLRKYTCLTVNEDQCMESNVTFQIHVEWLSCRGREYEKKDKRMNIFICDCVSSSCNETMNIYITNEAFYFEKIKPSSTGTFHCRTNQTGILDEIMTTTNFENADIDFMELTYTFGGIAAVLAVFLLFGSAVTRAMFLRQKRRWQITELPSQSQVERSFQVEQQSNEHLLPEYLEITDSVHYHPVEWRNYSLERLNASNMTNSRNTSAYESIDSRNSNNETTNEMYNLSDDSTNNSIERSAHAVVHQYVNTNIGNAYEQLKNPSTDINTYDDVNADD